MLLCVISHSICEIKLFNYYVNSVGDTKEFWLQKFCFVLTNSSTADFLFLVDSRKSKANCSKVVSVTALEFLAVQFF